MKFRRQPNPNRNHPLYCPYCAGEDLFPDEETDFAWSCQECLRVFSVQFHGQDEPTYAPQPAISTNQALKASMNKTTATASVTALETPRYRDPEQSPEGTVTPPTLSETTAARNAQLVADYADSLHDASAEEIMAWAEEHVPGDFTVTLSMENTVLAELAARHAPRADFLFLDTGYHFDETLEVADAVDARYRQRLVRARPLLSKNEQDNTYGPRLYARNPAACCRMRKVEPLQAELANYAGWVTGLRREDSPLRVNAPALALDEAGRLKINPLVTWTLDETNEYAERHDLISHPLTSQGYPSIGCATCTLPVAAGDDPRAGRWAGNTKTECGLHT